MLSLPHLATVLEHVLTTVADEAAVAVGFIRRRRALVLGWLGQPDASLHQLTQALAVRGAALSPQGLAQRFGPAAAALLERVLAAGVACLSHGCRIAKRTKRPSAFQLRLDPGLTRLQLSFRRPGPAPARGCRSGREPYLHGPPPR